MTATDDLTLVEAALIEGEVVEDLVASLARLRQGDLGDTGGTRVVRFLRRQMTGSQFAGLYGPAQLDKAARAAVPYVAAIQALRGRSGDVVAGLVGELDRLHIDDLAAVLADRATTTRSSALDDAADRFQRAQAALARGAWP